MNQKIYFMLIHKSNSGFWGEFPDLPGCMTDGKDQDDLLRNATDALASWIDAKIRLGEALPETSSLESVKGYAMKCDDDVVSIIPVTTFLPDTTLSVPKQA